MLLVLPLFLEFFSYCNWYIARIDVSSLSSHTAPPFLNRQFRLNRLSSPADFDPGIGTEDATLISLVTKDGYFPLILMKNGSAALSLLNKVCNSIFYMCSDWL
jgi:hypothetical protein